MNWSTCIHEAAHVVLSYRQGGWVKFAQVNKFGGVVQPVGFYGKQEDAVVTAGGYIAQLMFTGEYGDPSSDFEQIAAFSNTKWNPEEAVRKCARLAFTYLSEPKTKGALFAVAKALEQRGYLTMNEIDQIIAPYKITPYFHEETAELKHTTIYRTKPAPQFQYK